MRTPPNRAAIRELFLRRKLEYTTREAARLLGMPLGEFLALVHRDVLHVEHRRKRKQLGGARHALVNWQELASAALLRWSVVDIHDALGKEANRVLPSLLRPVTLKEVRLPEYLVRMLDSFARDAGVSVETYLYDALLHLETAMPADEIEKLLPGFGEAMRFPE